MRLHRLGVAALWQATAARALLLLAHGRPDAEQVVDQARGFRGFVSRYLGLLAGTLERWADAATHFDEALAMNERMGARPWLALTERDYGRMLLTRGGEGARERARELLDRAEATYRELGMAPS